MEISRHLGMDLSQTSPMHVHKTAKKNSLESVTHVPASFVCTWIFNNITNAIAFGITLGYWTLVYDGMVFSWKFPDILEWIYHKLHLCMCIEKPKKLLMSQWPIAPLTWFSCRTAVSFYTIMTLIIHFINHVVYSHVTHVPASFVFSWIFNNLSNATAFGITFGYWVHVYDGAPITDVDRIISSIMNSVITLLDICMSETPVHVAHFYQPFIVFLTYAIFNYVYYVSGGTNEDGKRWIYTDLKWDNITPKSIIFIMIGGSIVCFASHYMVILISWIRSQIAASAQIISYSS
uniref:Uncharacterized protein n=1 Tax=Strigamia maritima TaxID=126957 RepID=T1J7W4_STRMM